jgi:ATP-binding cassette, subfamily B, bacterial
MTKPLQKSSLSFAWQYLKTEKKAFILAIIFVIINALLQLLTPISIEFLINNAIKTPNYDLLWRVIVAMCFLFLVEAGLFRTQVKTVGYAAQRIMLKIRVQLFDHIQKLPTSYFGQNKSGDLISRINSDTTLLDNFLGQYIFQFTSSFFVFIAFGIYLLFLNQGLALVAYLGVLITFIISYCASGIGKIINKRALTNNGQLKAYLADNLNNYQVIQAYNIHANLSEQFSKINTENQKVNFAGRIFTNIFNPIYNFTSYLAIVLILVAILYFGLGQNPAYIGTLVAFLFATIKFFTPLRELGSVFGSLTEVQAALVRIREILDEPIGNVFKHSLPINTTVSTDLIDNNSKKVDFAISNLASQEIFEIHNSHLRDSKKPIDNQIAIQFQNVSFEYPDTKNQILNSISFQVPANSKFAIIGPTGEGKSTIAKLMSGLLSPNSGTIKVHGQQLKDWSQEEFYDTVGFILQDPFLFTGTVASNIIYGNPNYVDFNMPIIKQGNIQSVSSIKLANIKKLSTLDSESSTKKVDDIESSSTATKDLIRALIKDIEYHELGSIIPNLEEFLKTEVNNNSQNISQGQKQIVNFIRVLLREPKILILDEATANLDTITESYLQNALDKLNSKVTQIIIAHRQNTIKDADQIMLVGGGKVTVETKSEKPL